MGLFYWSKPDVLLLLSFTCWGFCSPFVSFSNAQQGDWLVKFVPCVSPCFSPDVDVSAEAHVSEDLAVNQHWDVRCDVGVLVPTSALGRNGSHFRCPSASEWGHFKYATINRLWRSFFLCRVFSCLCDDNVLSTPYIMLACYTASISPERRFIARDLLPSSVENEYCFLNALGIHRQFRKKRMRCSITSIL